jgi:hypothetical protein
MKLPIATEGPCKGHPCDNCRTCQRGRCCRNDNPDYQLPTLGEWAGPIYGDLGVLNDDGDKAECHCCGKFFGHLGSHIWQAHNLTPDEYKAIFGLNRGTGLIGPTLQAKRAAEMRKPSRRDQIRRMTDLGMKILQDATPEQRSHWSAHERRLQEATLAGKRLKEWVDKHGVSTMKVTDDQIREIRRIRPIRTDERRELADRYGISDITIRNILRGWVRPLPDDPPPVRVNGNAKLTEEQVRAIRANPPSGSKERETLAGQLGVSEWTISDIIDGKHWSWLDQEDLALSEAVQ